MFEIAQRTFLKIGRDLKLVARVALDHLNTTTLRNVLREGSYTANIVETARTLSTPTFSLTGIRSHNESDGMKYF
jgi:hypothetical protein